MRLLKIQLVNYIGIYNGMGLDSITIDLTKCINKILVIKGDNGSGKSTIYKAMSLFNDNSIEFRPGLPSKKNIVYLLDDGSLLDITYTTSITKSGTRTAPRSSIKRIINNNAVELNPSMNVTTAKDILFDLFDLDDNYVALSQLSANSKGLGSYKPQDRKRYINNIINSLTDYMEINKLLTKKSGIAKSLKTNIANKIDQIGNVDILSNTINIDSNQLKQFEERKDFLNKKIAEINYKINQFKDIDGIDLLNKFNESEKRINMIKSSISSIDISKIPKEINESIINSYEKDLSEIEMNIKFLNEKLEFIKSNKQELNEELNQSTIELSSFSNEELLEDTDSKINELKDKLNFYINTFNSMGFHNYDNVTEEEYNTALSVIENINKYIEKLSDDYYESCVNESLNMIKSGSNINKEEIVNSDMLLLHSFEKNLGLLEKELEYQNNNKKESEKLKLIPKQCTYSNICPFVESVIKSSKNYSDEYIESLEIKIEETKTNIESVRKLLEKKQNIANCVNDIKFILEYANSMKTIVHKFSGSNILDNNNLFHHISNILKYDIELDEYKKYSSYISAIKSTKEDIESLENKKESYSIKFDKINSLRSNIEKLYEKISKLNDSKSTLLAQLKEYENKKIDVSNTLKTMYTEKEIKDKYSGLLTEYDELNEFIEKYKKDIEELKELKNSLLSYSDECNRLSHNDIPLLRDKLENNKYRLTLFNQYVKELKDYEIMYDKIQQLKYYTGINGIQTIYMEVFMNNILQDANRLLRFLFNGRFTLKPFVINETEFRIPCIDDEGNERPDISLMSDSQLSMISMIISFVLLHRASNKYNIIKLDEVDNNLDNINRLQFSILIDNIMNILNFHQCIIISHNNELNLNNTDMILFRMDNNENYLSFKNSGANIIYDYNMGGQM